MALRCWEYLRPPAPQKPSPIIPQKHAHLLHHNRPATATHATSTLHADDHKQSHKQPLAVTCTRDPASLGSPQGCGDVAQRLHLKQCSIWRRIPCTRSGQLAHRLAAGAQRDVRRRPQRLRAQQGNEHIMCSKSHEVPEQDPTGMSMLLEGVIIAQGRPHQVPDASSRQHIHASSSHSRVHGGLPFKDACRA